LSDRLLERDYRIRAALDAEALDLRSVFPVGGALRHVTAAGAVADKPVGTITSSVFSFALGGPLCLGYIRTESEKESVTLQTPAGFAKMRQVELPLPSGTRSP
jgi:glycine cleavage system aminomethyltransferase T